MVAAMRYNTVLHLAIYDRNKQYGMKQKEECC